MYVWVCCVHDMRVLTLFAQLSDSAVCSEKVDILMTAGQPTAAAPLSPHPTGLYPTLLWLRRKRQRNAALTAAVLALENSASAVVCFALV